MQDYTAHTASQPSDETDFPMPLLRAGEAASVEEGGTWAPCVPLADRGQQLQVTQGEPKQDLSTPAGLCLARTGELCAQAQTLGIDPPRRLDGHWSASLFGSLVPVSSWGKPQLR